MAEETLMDTEPKVKKIVFVDHSLKMIPEAFMLFCCALNVRRRCCTKDFIPQTFIEPKAEREYGA